MQESQWSAVTSPQYSKPQAPRSPTVVPICNGCVPSRVCRPAADRGSFSLPWGQDGVNTWPMGAVVVANLSPKTTPRKPSILCPKLEAAPLWPHRKCRDPGSNRGPSDLRSDALPAELSRLMFRKLRAQHAVTMLCPTSWKAAHHHLAQSCTRRSRCAAIPMVSGDIASVL